MARPIWSGAISFGLVNVPVKLITAQRQKDIHFNQLDGSDGTRIQQKRVRPDTGEEVPYERLVKGYEISPGRFVVIEPQELETLDPKATHSIDIEEFVDLDQIDPLYFERGYYLVPDKGAAKPYRLLARAMGEANKVAIARFVMRTKQYLAAIRAKGDVLVLSTMLYGDEVESMDEVGVSADDAEVSDREVKMAEQLIESLSADFDPDRYHDDYREKVLALIDAKAEGQEIVMAAEPEQPTKVVDLMAALEASLAAAKGGKGSKGGKSEDGDGNASSKEKASA